MSNHGQDILYVRARLHAASYWTAIFKNDLGSVIPQRRMRVFIIAIRADVYSRLGEAGLQAALLRTWHFQAPAPTLAAWQIPQQIASPLLDDLLLCADDLVLYPHGTDQGRSLNHAVQAKTLTTIAGQAGRSLPFHARRRGLFAQTVATTSGPRWPSTSELLMLMGFPREWSTCVLPSGCPLSALDIRPFLANAVAPLQLLCILAPLLSVHHRLLQQDYNMDALLQRLIDAVAPDVWCDVHRRPQPAELLQPSADSTQFVPVVSRGGPATSWLSPMRTQVFDTELALPCPFHLKARQ